MQTYIVIKKKSKKHSCIISKYQQLANYAYESSKRRISKPSEEIILMLTLYQLKIGI